MFLASDYTWGNGLTKVRSYLNLHSFYKMYIGFILVRNLLIKMHFILTFKFLLNVHQDRTLTGQYRIVFSFPFIFHSDYDYCVYERRNHKKTIYKYGCKGAPVTSITNDIKWRHTTKATTVMRGDIMDLPTLLLTPLYLYRKVWTFCFRLEKFCYAKGMRAIIIQSATKVVVAKITYTRPQYFIYGILTASISLLLTVHTRYRYELTE